jgi:diguanylate cyclase (GGDEF)-like protein
MTRVFIVGAGKGGQTVLGLLLPLPFIKILGVSDCNPDAPAIQSARKTAIPVVLTDPIATLKALDVDIVFDLTGDSAMHATLHKLSENRFSLATGAVTHLLIQTMVGAVEKGLLLKKHLEISLLIAQSETLDQVFNTIVEGSMEITSMPAGSVAVFNKETGMFTLMAQKGLPPGLTRGAAYPIRMGGLTQHILVNNGPTVISDLTLQTKMDCTALIQAGVRSLIAIPLFAEQELLGILYNDDIVPRNYPSGLVDVLYQFATEAVLTIQKQKAMMQIRHLSSRDPLTGLYNRTQMVLQLKELLPSAQKNNETVALLIVDIDRFKEMNETLGHQYGDQALQITAERIRLALSKEESGGEAPVLFRSGADEIAIILLNTTYENAARKAVLIRNAVCQMSSDRYFPLDVSIGAALYPEHGQSVDQIISRASRSLLIAKKMDEKVSIGSVLPFADSDRLGIKLEPIVDIPKNQVIGYEALSRDIHGRFSVPVLFEKYNKLGHLQEVKVTCFISQLRMAKEMNLSRVFLNVDSTLLKQCEWIQKPENIDVVLEISEGESLHDLEGYLRIAEEWRRKGFTFAIDDFGAGFVSLPFISRLNPEYVKIDRSVIVQAVATPEFRSFLNGIIVALKKGHVHRVIAEGVETETELAVVREMGIDLVQGFLLRDKGFPAPIPKDLYAAEFS